MKKPEPEYIVFRRVTPREKIEAAMRRLAWKPMYLPKGWKPKGWKPKPS